MSRLSDIRAMIVAVLRDVPDIGQVHDRERFLQNATGLQALYAATIGGAKLVRGWHVRRIATVETSPAIGSFRVLHSWEIRGFSGFDDAAGSELAFDDLVEAIRAAFRSDDELGGAVDGTVDESGEHVAGIELVESVPVMFAGVLCHSARLALQTWHLHHGEG